MTAINHHDLHTHHARTAGFYLGFDGGDEVMTLTQPAAPGAPPSKPSAFLSSAASTSAPGAASSASASDPTQQQQTGHASGRSSSGSGGGDRGGGSSSAGKGKGFCDDHQFMMRAGLDGQKGTVSFEAVSQIGHYVSAYM